MIQSINLIFWGLLLVILDININHIDFLPDFIGYILAAIGAGGLINSSPQFATARISCWVLFVLSISYFFIRGQLLIILGFADLIINCIMMWFLLGGFRDISLMNKRPDLAAKAVNRRVIYIILSCIAKFVSFVGQENREIASAAIVIIVVAMLVILIMILHLIYQIKNTVTQNTNNSLESIV